MRALSLVVFLVASALSAPVEEVKEVKEVKEVVEPALIPEARHSLLHSAIPYNAPGYYKTAQYVVPQQFGARITPYQQYQQYQQYNQYHGLPQYQYHGQTYYPAQGYVQGSPYYQGSAYHSGAYYPGVTGHYYPQTYSTLSAAKKTSSVKTVVPVNHEAERFSSVVATPGAAPVVRAHAAPTPANAPAHIVKTAVHPGHPEPFHAIVRQSHDDNFDGSFAYSYETDHGVVVESTGYLKNAGTPDQVQVMQGSYTYYTPEGIPIITTYIADENGFQVQGDHLPQPPEMPEAIAKSIAYQRSLPPSEEDIVEQERARAAVIKTSLKH